MSIQVQQPSLFVSMGVKRDGQKLSILYNGFLRKMNSCHSLEVGEASSGFPLCSGTQGHQAPGPSRLLPNPIRARAVAEPCSLRMWDGDLTKKGEWGSWEGEDWLGLLGKKGACLKISTAGGTSPECTCFNDGSQTGLNVNSDQIKSSRNTPFSVLTSHKDNLTNNYFFLLCCLCI